MDFKQFLFSLLKLSEHPVSDLHFKVGCPPLLRVAGELIPAKFAKLSSDDTHRIACAVMQRSEPLGPEFKSKDTSFEAGTVRFRAAIFRQQGDISIVLRVIPMTIPTVGELGLPPVLEEIALEARGMILVTGVTGSGKSTTLAAMIDHINTNRRGHILTIEDPVEFIHSDKKCAINQREVGRDTPSFADALREGLRQDPDVIMVGEMRDLETIEIAMKAAETGHLVLSTLHTVDAEKTINRVIDAFPLEHNQAARYMLGSNLRAVISQRLLPKAGKSERVAAVEIMRVTSTIESYIVDPEKTSEISDAIFDGKSQYQMQTFDQHLTELYNKKIITREAAVAASSNPADFERAMMFE